MKQRGWGCLATKAELVEFFKVALTMQGCPGQEWSLETKTLRVWEKLLEGRAIHAVGSIESRVDPGCCSTPEV